MIHFNVEGDEARRAQLEFADVGIRSVEVGADQADAPDREAAQEGGGLPDDADNALNADGLLGRPACVDADKGSRCTA
jgi:hypothetical protein